MTDRVLVLGSGGTEERLCGALALSAHVKQVFFAPGTEGMSDSEKITRSAVITSNPAILKQFCKDHNISLVIISTKSLLTSGLMDDLSRSGVRCFGPTMKAAQLQDNKKFAKDFMEQLNIPTARWKSFTNPHKACSFITYTDFPALVVKAMTSSSGRDSHIARDKDDACRAVQQLTQDWILGSSTTIVIEERLEGKEYICLSLTDGLTLAPLPFVHISKHQLQDDASPAMIQMSEKNSKKVQENILRKAIDAMRQEGWGYKGLFGAKVMMTGKGPIVLGFICTFQDLKSQMIVPLLKPDLYEVIQSAIEEKLSSHAVMWELASMTKMDNCGPGTTAKHRDHDAGNTSAKPVSDVSESCGVIDAAPAGVAKCNKVVAFPGMAFRKDYPSVTQRRRHKIHCPEETHTKNDSFSDDAWAGPTVSKNIHQPVGRKTRYFEINTAPYKDPVFVHSSRSIGDKIKVALACNLHKSAAQSLVTTCMNDLLAQGAQTLYFVARCDCGQLSTDVTEAIEEGLALGCRLTGATVLENELKPPLDVYTDGSYHLSGFGLGIVERDHTLLRPDQMRAGDLILGIRSPGSCSSNDLSLLTDLMKREMIMNSTMVVSPPVLHALQCGKVSACVPITEGGLVGSILHYLPEHMGIIIDALCWKVPAIVSWLYKEGELSEEELVYHFNCGLGAVLIAQKNEAQKTLAEIQHEEEAWMIGSVLQRHEDLPHVQVRNFLEALKLNSFQLLKNVILHKAPAKISKAAVLISTAGPKLKLVMDTIRQLGSCVRLSLVISNKSAVEELKKAAGAGIPTRVIDHTMFGCHSEFERVICKVLEEFSIDLICIAGFGRILSGQFPMRWRGKILKLYSSLFPSMKIDKSSTTGSKVRGCTMCFLLDGNIPGPSILQETFTAESEGAMEDAEERAVAKALHLVASGGVTLGPDGCVSWISGDWTHK